MSLVCGAGTGTPSESTHDSETVAFLERQAPLQAIQPSAQLAAAARSAAADLGPHGLSGHVGTDGSTSTQRMQREGVFASIFAEEISLGQASAADVVRQLVIDATSPSQSHRGDLFSAVLRFAGVGCGPHRGYRWMCVIDLTSTILVR